MLQRKRGARAGGPWCGDLAAHSPEGEGSAFRGGKRVIRRGGSKKKSGGWDTVDDADNGPNGTSRSKRVMVVADHSQESKLALKWALSHVVHQLDVITLLYVQPQVTPKQSFTSHGGFFSAKAAEEQRRKTEIAAWEITNSFKTIVASSRPEVEVDILIVEGEKGPTIVAQSKKLEVSILVLGQRKPSVLWRLMKKKTESLADFCINNSDCLTLAVRKKNRRLGGYLINSQWQKNFWLLA
ncbi:unnamed protein product [Calypogeia fissa]